MSADATRRGRAEDGGHRFYYVLLCVAVGLLMFTTVLAVRSAHTLRESVGLTLHSQEVLRSAERIWSLRGDVGVAAYAYLVEREPDQLARYREARLALVQALEAMAVLVADNPQQQVRVAELDRLMRLRLTFFDGVLQVAGEHGPAVAVPLLRDPASQQVGLDARSEIEAIAAFERDLLAGRERGMRALLGETASTTLIANSLAFVSALVGFAMIRRIRRGRERARALEWEREKAEAASREKSAFLASMSHEFRTPMNAIFGFSQLLAGRLEGRREQAWVRAIDTSGRTLLALIDDILDLSRIEAGRLELDPRPTDVRDVVDGTVGALAQVAADKGLGLEVAIDPALPRALVLDAARLRQVLFNLLGNALKYTDAGHVRVELAAHRGEDGRRCSLDLRVADTGIGIEPAQLSGIFEPFARTSGAQAHAEGTGLGLSICRRLVELMGGRIEARSRLGEGSVFAVWLPGLVVADEAAVRDVDAPVDFRRLAPARLLVVDDVSLNRELLADLLGAAGHQVHLAGGGQEAVRLATELRPDAVLMDIRMPGLDGRGALAALRAEPATRPIPVLAVTASSLLGEEEELRSAFDGYVRKPLRQAELFAALAAVLPAAAPGDRALAPGPGTGAPVETAGRDAGAAPTPEVDAAALREELARLCAKDWPALRLVPRMREARGFAGALERIGEGLAHPPLRDFGRRLQAAVARFDVPAVESMLAQFEAHCPPPAAGPDHESHR